MNFTRSESSDVGELFQITPMVDMVFTLLAFFIMATHIAMPERDLDLGYQAGLAPGAMTTDFPQSVSVQLRAVPAGVGITIGQVTLADNDFAALSGRLGQINLPALPVQLAADPNLKVEQVSLALDAVLASPMKKVALSRLETP